MANGWDGVDPTMENEPGVDYELATRYLANNDVSITGVRVWAGALSESVSGRKARLWSTAGALLAELDIDAALPSGWTNYDLVEPVSLTSGSSADVSYSTLRYYGATPGGYPNPSADGLVSATQGRFHNTPGTFPNTPSPAGSFYGIDIIYSAAGNLAPEITNLAVTADDLDATAVVTLTDESPASVTARWLWGDGEETTTGAGVLTDDHSYAEPGLYAVGVIVTDNTGQKDFGTAAVVVRNPGVGLDIDAAIGELAARLETIPGVTAVDKYGPQLRKVNPPHIFVTLPTDPISYSQTYDPETGEAGATEMTAKIVVALGKVHSLSAYQALAAYASIPGDRSIKSVIESGVYVHMDDPVVTVGVFDEYTIAGDEYLVSLFDVHLMR